MPPKQKKCVYSINQELYEKSMKPAVTIAMGMKPSHNSASCWRAQVEKEQQIHDNWARKYDSKMEKKRLRALEHTLEREKNKYEAFRTNNDALYTILYKKDAANPRGTVALYLKARKKFSPQEKYTTPQTSAQNIGWAVVSSVKSCESSTLPRLYNPEKRILQFKPVYRRPDDCEHAEFFGYSLDYTH